MEHSAQRWAVTTEVWGRGESGSSHCKKKRWLSSISEGSVQLLMNVLSLSLSVEVSLCAGPLAKDWQVVQIIKYFTSRFSKSTMFPFVLFFSLPLLILPLHLVLFIHLHSIYTLFSLYLPKSCLSRLLSVRIPGRQCAGGTAGTPFASGLCWLS